MIKICLFLCCTLILVNAFSQNTPRKYTINGYVTDAVNTETLIGASVYDKDNYTGTSTNQYGFYSLTLNEGTYSIVFSFVGYETQTVDLHLRGDTTININLTGIIHLQEVKVVASKADRIQEKTQMSSISLPIAQVKSLPAFLGEVDLLKTLQLMPGIQSGGEGTSGLYVRGGGPDQNLILLDGVPVYNVSHLFGFFSVFNADAINSMEIIKGGFPARYGGRISSVLDINMKEGNTREFHGEGAIGLVASRLTLEGPIWKDRTSFIVSGRRTYIDLLAKPFIALANSQNDGGKLSLGYYFYDLTAKVNHKFSDKDRIYLSAYMGDDKFYVNTKEDFAHYNTRSENELKWGNITAAFRWNHIFTNKLFGNTTLTYSRYRFLTGMEYEESYTGHDGFNPINEESYYLSRYISGIHDWSGKIAFDYIPSPNHYIRFGGSATHHTFSPGVMQTKSDTISTEIGASKMRTLEYAAYVEDDIRITPNLKVNVGLHWSAFDVDNKFYNVIQPRISARYLITPQLSVKTAYSRMAQYIHLLTNSSIGLPTDLWVPSTGLLKPQKSDQVAVGLAQNFKEEYEISLEGYYKTMGNVMEYKEGATFFDISDNWEDKILQGDGRSYGVELFAQKKTGSFTGWIGYTLSWTDRQFDELNNGKRFFYKYDRRHDLSIALIKKFSEKIEMSATWVFGSGSWTTLPTGTYELENPIIGQQGMNNYYFYGSEYINYGERNGYRMGAYHRLDVGISFIKQKRWGERRWVLGVYNAYSRNNPFYVDINKKYRFDANGSSNAMKYEFVQYSLFPIIPSISYQFKF